MANLAFPVEGIKIGIIRTFSWSLLYNRILSIILLRFISQHQAISYDKTKTFRT